MKSETFILAHNMPYDNAEPGVRRQVLAYDKHITLVKVVFDAGAQGAEHAHPHCQATYVAKGIFEVNINGATKTLQKGDSFYVAPNLPHGVKCVEAGVLVDSFSPAREDFIRK